jgi:DNA-3-methyladenine glycosylase II
MIRIATQSDIESGLDALCGLDPRLIPVRAGAGALPLRRSPPGFESLASIIVSQQVSRASADAIFGRLSTLLGPLTAARLLAADETVFRTAGLSRPKVRSLVATARAVEAGLDLTALCDLPAEEAVAALTAIPGIGPWTAECYLLFSAGHADVFPARDVALQTAVGHALGHAVRPDARLLSVIAESWAPWRGVAARLFWAYYASLRGREAAPLPKTP